jgi:hypothetical protein
MRPIGPVNMNLAQMGQHAAQFSNRMSQLAAQAATDPTIVQDPQKVAQFSIDLFNAQSGFQLATRAIQTLNKEDQILNELLRDA